MDGFAVFKIVAELGGLGLLFRDQATDQIRFVFKQLPDSGPDVGILTEFLCQDIPRALQGLVGCLDMLIHESLCFLHRISPRLLLQQQ